MYKEREKNIKRKTIPGIAKILEICGMKEQFSQNGNCYIKFHSFTLMLENVSIYTHN